jgi:hypothetical protein
MICGQSQEIIMVSLKGMDAQALLSLRKQIDQRLVELRAELEKQLAALDGQAKASIRISSSLKGKKVPTKYRSAKVRLGPEGAQNLDGSSMRSRVGRSSMSS